MDVRLQPDATTLTIAYLKSSTDLQALISQRVSVDISTDSVVPRVQVVDVTGSQTIRRQLRETVLDIFSWAGTRPAALAVAQTVDAVLMEMSGAVAGAVVSHVRVVTPPVWRPDPSVDTRARYQASYGITLHP